MTTLINECKTARRALRAPEVVANSTRILSHRSVPPTAVVLSKDPFVYYIDNFLTNTECEYIIAKAKPGLDAAKVSSSSEGGVRSQSRTNSLCWIWPNGDRGLEMIEDKICDLVACRPECTEAFQVIHYVNGQEYKPHWDAYDVDTKHGIENCKRGGNRIITTLLYLSDVEKGGSTSFPKLGIEVAAKKRRVCVFHNCRPGKQEVRDERTMHAGTPVLKGVKWAVNKWIREIPMQQPRPRRLPPVSSH